MVRRKYGWVAGCEVPVGRAVGKTRIRVMSWGRTAVVRGRTSEGPT